MEDSEQPKEGPVIGEICLSLRALHNLRTFPQEPMTRGATKNRQIIMLW